jgi:hypothetical protein
VQEHNSFLTNGSVADAHSIVLILPNGTATHAGASQHAGLGGSVSIPRPLLNNPTTVSVEVDAAIFADGLVVGSDEHHLVAELQGEADAARKMKDILSAANGRDPKPDIDKAIAEAPRGSATQRWLTIFSHTGRGPLQITPQMQLPDFHR